MTAPVVDDADVKQLLSEHQFLEAVFTGEGEQQRVRVRCELTQHEMLPRKDAIEAHLKSKKFIKAKEWYCYDYSKYEPFIVAHRRKPKSLFCNVTSTVLNRIPTEVEKHVNGKKFQRLKAHVKFTQRKGEGEGDGEKEDDDEEEFDANAFEFENAQVLMSDDEEGEEEAGSKKKGKKKGKSDDEDDSEDDSEEDEEEDGDEDSDLADFYPDEDDDDDGRMDHETVVKLAQQPTKKRKAEDDKEDDDNGAEESEKKTKKPKQAKPVSSARMNSKQRRQMKKPNKAAFRNKTRSCCP